MDIIFGGCFGETISALKINDKYKKYHNYILNKYISEIIMDEITHCALSWSVIKYILDNNKNLNISNKK